MTTLKIHGTVWIVLIWTPPHLPMAPKLQSIQPLVKHFLPELGERLEKHFFLSLSKAGHTFTFFVQPPKSPFNKEDFFVLISR